MRIALTRPVSTCLLTVAVAAQGRVWTVDAQNRPGTDFTDFPPAVTAAADGDMIRVRDGTYAGTTISKGLTVLFDPGVLFNGYPYLTIQNVPAGRQVVFKGLALVPSILNLTFLGITNNQGRVLLDRIAVANTSVATVPALAIADSRQVQINSCSFAGGSSLGGPGAPAMRVVRSTVAISDCQMRGGSAAAVHSVSGSSALVAQDADVTVSRGTLDGGAGVSPLFLTDQPAIVSANSRIELRGDATTQVRAGQGHFGAVSAVLANGGSVTFDPAVSLLSNNTGVPTISGSAAVVTTWLPSLSARGTGPGGVVNADLFSPVGDIALFLTSVASDPIAVPPAGTFWLDPLQFFVTGVGAVGASGHLSHSIPLSIDANLSFGAWALQSLSGTFTGGFRLSNPVGYVLVD